MYSLNRAQVIGNLTRDPEVRTTTTGQSVASFGVATNRRWTDAQGQRKEEVEFHRIVSWNKLAELCSQLLAKGRKVYVEGRLQTRKWTGQDGQERTTTEIVISDMIILDSRFAQAAAKEDEFDVPEEFDQEAPVAEEAASPKSSAPKVDDKKQKTTQKKKDEVQEVKESDDDIPF